MGWLLPGGFLVVEWTGNQIRIALPRNSNGFDCAAGCLAGCGGVCCRWLCAV